MKKKIDFEITKEGKLPITKIDAAVRQLETAIRLWFYDADPVSIATLTYAGYQIISDLKKQKDGKPLLMNYSERVKEEYQDAVRDLFRETQNFLKHANHDQTGTHHFSPEITIVFALEACDTYTSWNLEKRPVFELFSTWMRLNKPELFKTDIRANNQDSGVDYQALIDKGKRGYFEETLHLFSKIH